MLEQKNLTIKIGPFVIARLSSERFTYESIGEPAASEGPPPRKTEEARHALPTVMWDAFDEQAA
jgi:hypothetical protein